MTNNLGPKFCHGGEENLHSVPPGTTRSVQSCILHNSMLCPLSWSGPAHEGTNSAHEGPKMTPTSAPALTPWMVSSNLSPEGLAPTGMAHTGLYVFQPPSGYVLKKGIRV